MDRGTAGEGEGVPEMGHWVEYVYARRSSRAVAYWKDLVFDLDWTHPMETSLLGTWNWT